MTTRTRTTTRTATKRRRSGLIHYLSNMVDDTKDFVDDLLDRGRDTEHDLRDTARRTFDHVDDDDIREELAELRTALVQLAEKVGEMTDQQRARADEEQDTPAKQSTTSRAKNS